MSLRVIGAGLGRTGTKSLQAALEILLKGPCYHMFELFEHLEEHTPYWMSAANAEKVEWDQLFEGYTSAVDEPTSFMWKELMEYYPDALIILSVREAASWWKSANATILPIKQNPPPTEPPEKVAWHQMIMKLYEKVYPQGVSDAELTQQCFLTHIERVKAGVPSSRLLIWQAGDGWEPICHALNLPVPSVPFPHSNTTNEFIARQVHE